MALEVDSSSVRRTQAFEVLPHASATCKSRRDSRRWERRYMMGQRSVAMPKRESTELSGEGEGVLGRLRGAIGEGLVEIGAVPYESAVITS